MLNNKGMAFIAAFSIYAILLVLTVTFLWMTDTDLNISVNQRDTTKALYAGDGGLEYGIYKLLTGWTWPGDSKDLGDGSFKVEVTELANGRKEVLSTGICQQPLARGQMLQSKRKVQVTLNPPAFRYAVFSRANMVLSATTVGSTGLVGTGSEGDVHSNGTVSQSGSVTVEGTVTQGTPTVLIPNVSMSDYRAEAQASGSYATGTLTITPANDQNFWNMVVYRTGSITINSSTGAIILTGTTLVTEVDIIIRGANSITITPDSEPLADTAYPSMVTENGNIYTAATGPTAFTNILYAKLLIYSKNGYINLHNLNMGAAYKGTVMAGRTANPGVTLRTTASRSWQVIYDNTILTTNKPKYFTVPVDTAALFWKEVY